MSMFWVHAHALVVHWHVSIIIVVIIVTSMHGEELDIVIPIVVVTQLLERQLHLSCDNQSVSILDTHFSETL
jgi:hypothetical protein